MYSKRLNRYSFSEMSESFICPAVKQASRCVTSSSGIRWGALVAPDPERHALEPGKFVGGDLRRIPTEPSRTGRRPDIGLDVEDADNWLVEAAVPSRTTLHQPAVGHRRRAGRQRIRPLGCLQGEFFVRLPVVRAYARDVNDRQAIPVAGTHAAGRPLCTQPNARPVAVRDDLHEGGLAHHGSTEHRDDQPALPPPSAISSAMARR